MMPEWFVSETILLAAILPVILVAIYGLCCLIDTRASEPYVHGYIGNSNTARRDVRTGDVDQLVVDHHGVRWIPADGWENTFKETL